MLVHPPVHIYHIELRTDWRYAVVLAAPTLVAVALMLALLHALLHALFSGSAVQRFFCFVGFRVACQGSGAASLAVSVDWHIC